MKNENACELNVQSQRGVNTSIKDVPKRNYFLLVLTIGLIFTMIFNASLIIISSGISLAINLDLCYTDLIIASIILLIFLKSYRINHSGPTYY